MTIAEDVFRANQRRLERLQRSWPATVRLDDRNETPIYNAYPYFFRAAFPPLPDRVLHQLSLAFRLYADSIFIVDGLVDGDSDESGGLPPLRLLARQFESYRLLYDLFPSDSRFWDRFRGLLATYADACARERGFLPAAAGWLKCTEEQAVEISDGKACVAKVVVVALGELSGDERHVEALSRTIAEFNVAIQYLDDLTDWRSDLERGKPSLFLHPVYARCAGLDPTRVAPGEVIAVAQELYYGGHALRLLEGVIRHVDRAAALVEGLPLEEWRASLSRLRRHADDLRYGIERIVRRNVRRARWRAAAAAEIPGGLIRAGGNGTAGPDVAAPTATSARADVDAALTRAVQFLESAQLEHGEFPTYVHLDVHFQTEGRYDSSPFVTSFVVYALSFLEADATRMLEKATMFLLEECEAPGVWRYWTSRSPKRIDADLDDTACISFALRRIAPDLDFGNATQAILSARRPDGLFRTWLRPEGQPNDVDSVVNANVLLWLGDRPETEPVAAKLQQILAAGAETGSYYYYLDDLALYYAIARAHANGCRSLAGCRRSGLERLGARRRDNGSFGDELQTALALCALLDWCAGPESRVDRTVEWLIGAQRADGGWASRAFCTGPEPPGPPSYWWGSETLTTALAVEALAKYRPRAA